MTAQLFEGPRRPLSREDVWELLRNGCNLHEVATAAGVSEAVAMGMVFEAIPRHGPRSRLTRSGGAPNLAQASAGGTSSLTHK